MYQDKILHTGNSFRNTKIISLSKFFVQMPGDENFSDTQGIVVQKLLFFPYVMRNKVNLPDLVPVEKSTN